MADKNIKVKVEDREFDPTAPTLYKVITNSKQKNIEVNCSYFETKGLTRRKFITCLVSIRVFSVKRPNKSIRYELYGNSLNTNYNHIVRLSADNDIPLRKGDRSYGTFKEVVDTINEEFDDITKNFIDCTMKLINAQGEITRTPQFVIDIIEQEREYNSEKVIK